MLKLAIIGASYLQLPLVRKAIDKGIYTLCFAWEKGAVCKEVADEFYPISIVDKEQILEVCKERQIDGICTIASDVAAPTVAYIAEQLGLIGNSYEVAVRASNKFQMRNAFLCAGIPCPKYQVVTSSNELHDDYVFPLIIKPTDRSGSLGVTKVTRMEDLSNAVESALEYSFRHEAIIEEFIEGREISVEFISYQGKHYPLQITDKVTTGAPHFVELEHHQPANLNHEEYTAIFELTKRALNALGITSGASHTEYKITTDGKVIVMETGARMGGDFIGSDLVYLSTGYDYLSGVIDVALGRFEKPTFGVSHCSGVYFLCEDTMRLLNVFKSENTPQIVRMEITDNILKKVSCSADRSGYLIYQANEKVVI